LWPEAPRAKARINGYTDTGAFLVYRLAPYWYILLESADPLRDLWNNLSYLNI